MDPAVGIAAFLLGAFGLSVFMVYKFFFKK